MKYTNNNFDITTINNFNNLDGLDEISNYLDFGINSTLQKHLPHTTEDDKKRLAVTMLESFMNGDPTKFTNDFRIRENILKIGKNKIKFLLCKSLIEKNAYNKRVLHMLSPSEYIDQCADYISQIIAAGEFDKIQDWIDINLSHFINEYASFKYNKKEETKEHYNNIALENPVCERALEQLNLEMHLNQIKNKS